MEFWQIALAVLIIVGVLAYASFKSNSSSPGARSFLESTNSLPTHDALAILRANQRINIAEFTATTPPDTSKAVSFPQRAIPITPFEDFNQRLFILKEEQPFTWPEKASANDFPTVLQGDLEWVRYELRSRLRVKYSVILDTYGWWAEASDQLELNPHANHPVIAPYLKLPVDQRPVVISRPRKKDSVGSDQLQLFRYKYEDYTFDRKFLGGFFGEMLLDLMLYLTADEKYWSAYSPARARKRVIDDAVKKRNDNAAREEFAESIRQAIHKNRFAALWNLPSGEKPEGGQDAENTTRPA